MGVLSKPKIVKLCDKQELIIESIDPEQPFNREDQITEDGIDLRLGVIGLRYKKELQEIDTLFQQDIQGCFEEVAIPLTGYRLMPGEVLFTSTLEIICLSTSSFVGVVYGRSTFARYGLSIHCAQPKFPPGIAWAFPLQLVNHNSIPLIIYPYMYIAQLQIHTTSGPAVSYEGKYDRDVTIRPPKINDRELGPIDRTNRSFRAMRELMASRLEEVRVIVQQFEERERLRAAQPSRQFRQKHIAIAEVILGTASAVFFGYFGNLLSTTGPDPEANYWRVVASILSLVLGIVFLSLLIGLSYFTTRKQP